MFFNKSNEGALYKDRTSGAQKADDIVRPGQIYTYRWTVPKEVGPSDSDAQCITWVYYSSVDPVKDTYSGKSVLVKSYEPSGSLLPDLIPVSVA